MAKKQIKKSIFKRVIAAALVLALAAVPTTIGLGTIAYAQSSSELKGDINTLEAEQDALRQQQQEVKDKLATLKKNKEKQLEYKQALDEQLTAIQKEVNVINKKIKALDKEIKAKQAEIKENEKVITETFAQLKKRIRALYLAGEASTLEILFNAENIADFADKMEVMRSITSHDSALIDTLKVELGKVKEQKALIEKDRQEVADARTELEGKKAEIQELVNESAAVIAEIEASENEANSLAAQLEAEFDATSSQLEDIYDQYYAALSEEEKKRQEEAADNVVQVGDKDYDNNYDAGNNFVQGSGTSYGQFIWPTPGTTIITSGVGPRWGQSHNGIDISSGNAYGQPIVASDGGTVIVAVHSGWGGGYGHHVMIDHGNGYVTVYGHASTVLVNTGDKVSQGQTIAYIGSTGWSTGPHLHFEIRKYGAICDPELYVSP